MINLEIELDFLAIGAIFCGNDCVNELRGLHCQVFIFIHTFTCIGIVEPTASHSAIM